MALAITFDGMLPDRVVRDQIKLAKPLALLAPPNHLHNDPQNIDLLRINRLHVGISRLQLNAIGFLEIASGHRTLSIDQRHYELAIAPTLLLFDDNDIAPAIWSSISESPLAFKQKWIYPPSGDSSANSSRCPA